MRLWTNTGLLFKGGPGGLLLDTGSGPSFLPLPAPVLEQVVAGNSEPGVTTLRLPDPNPRTPDLPAREIDLEVCFVCKKCRVAFSGESPLLIHQRQCFTGNLESRGAFRIVQVGYECKICGDVKYKSLQELKKHCEEEHRHVNQQNAGKTTGGHPAPSVGQTVSLAQTLGTAPSISGAKVSQLPPPSESPLSHEMEDVVNQITLLAARAAQESGPEPTAGVRVLDSNSNSFCQPAEPKRRFLSPADVQQQPLTSAGH